jgi:hypothetical protein
MQETPKTKTVPTTISKHESMEDLCATTAAKPKVKVPSPSLSEKSLSDTSETHARVIFEKLSTSRKPAKKDCAVKRSKGGGEEGEKVYQKFARVSMREDTTDLEELSRRSVATQVYVLRDF